MTETKTKTKFRFQQPHFWDQARCLVLMFGMATVMSQAILAFVDITIRLLPDNTGITQLWGLLFNGVLMLMFIWLMHQLRLQIELFNLYGELRRNKTKIAALQRDKPLTVYEDGPEEETRVYPDR